MLGLGSGACVQLAATPTRRPRSRRAERQLKRRRAKGATAAVGCASMAARAAPARMRCTCELRLQNQIQDCYAGSNDHENATAPSVRVYVNGKAPGTISCTKAEVECRSKRVASSCRCCCLAAALGAWLWAAARHAAAEGQKVPIWMCISPWEKY